MDGVKSYIATPWEVKALLEGRKSQFTVPVKNAEDDYSVTWCPVVVNGYGGYVNEHGRPRPWPYPVGTGVAVKEVYTLECGVDHMLPDIKPDRPYKEWEDEEWGTQRLIPHYKVTDPEPELCYTDASDKICKRCEMGDPHCHWQSPVTMPSWASRFTLKVTGVKVLRLGEVPCEAVADEGFGRDYNPFCGSPKCHCADRGACTEFMEVQWDRRYGKRFPYSSNPWVFSHTFEVVK